MNSSALLLFAADTAWQKGRAAEARTLYQQVLRIDPDECVALQRLAWLEDDLGHTTRAIDLLKRLVSVRPADARAQLNLGLCLKKIGSMDDALSAMKQAALINPAYTAAHCNLGLLLEATGDRAGAVGAMKTAATLAPESDFFAYHLAALGGGAAPKICPPDYLIALFDGYADQFDAHLFNTLSYTGPQLVADIVGDHGPPKPWDVMDLGCGTGITAVPFRPFARSITGVDLAPRMLQHARRRVTAGGRPIYDTLLQMDIVAALRQRAAALDLILAADVFIYIGDLLAVLSAARDSLRPGGLIAFTTESFPGPEDFRLNSTRRYAQSADYIARLSAHLSLPIIARRDAVLRLGDDGLPVQGNVFLLQRSPALFSPK